MMVSLIAKAALMVLVMKISLETEFIRLNLASMSRELHRMNP